MKKIFKAYVISKTQNGHRLYMGDINDYTGCWQSDILTAYFFKDKDAAIEKMNRDMENWKPYYDQYSKTSVTWEVLEIDMKVNKVE